MTDTDYQDFLAAKRISSQPTGFDVDKSDLNPAMHGWQADLTQWALRRGRAAFFWDCGLGKSIAQLEWARHAVQRTGKPVLILAPILVGWQTVEEAKKFNVECDVRFVLEACDCGDGINITNYERLHKFGADRFGGVVLDEAQILKSYMGVRKRQIIDKFARTPYKLSATATPAPNDLLELGNQADFLDVMPANEMIARWFISDSMHAGKYRLRKHGAADYWRWVSSWAVSLGSPADIGHDATGYVLPEMRVTEKIVNSTDSWFGSGDTRNASATNVHDEKRKSLEDRCRAVAELTNNSDEQWIVWCATDYEADELKRVVTDCVEIRGKHTENHKEKGLKSFLAGQTRVMITKPEIGGYGLNLQCCHNTTWFASYSFEKFYQAVRRIYRYGQKFPVNVHLIASEKELGIIDTVKKKIAAHAGMKCEIADAMKNFQIAEIYGRTLEEYKTCRTMSLPPYLTTKTPAAGRLT